MQKRSFLINFIGVTAAILISMFGGGIAVYADGTDQDEVTSSDIYHDIVDNGDGTYSIVQHNKVRTGDIFTRTIAYNITNPVTGEIVATVGRSDTNISEITTTDRATGWTYTTVTTKLTAEQSAIVRALATSGSGVQMDNVMALTFDGGDTFSAIWNGAQVVYNTAFSTTSTLAAYIYQQSGGDGAFGYGEMDTYINILTAIGFADPEGFRTNFEKLLKLGEDGQWYKLAKALLEDGETLDDALKRLEEEEEKTDDPASSDSSETDELQGFFGTFRPGGIGLTAYQK